ncbi:MAG: hypothetical protein QXR65_07100 [Candidatus Bathyarchaeia archaeon]
MSEEEILAVIKRHPEVIAEAPEERPNVLTSLMIRLAPWDRFATKDDIRMLMEFTEKHFEDVNKRFDNVNGRFEDLMHYVDKRVSLVEKLLVGFNIPIQVHPASMREADSMKSRVGSTVVGFMDLRLPSPFRSYG